MQIKDFYLSESYLGSFAQKLSFPLATEFLTVTAVSLFWYEGLFSKVGWGLLGGFVPSALLVLALLVSDKSKIKITRSTLYLLLFFIVFMFSGVLAVWRGVNPVIIISGWVLFAEFLIALLAVQGSKSPTRLVTTLMYLSVPMITVGAYQFLTKQATSPLWVTPAEAGITTRAFAFFGSPNILGAVLATVALVAAGLYFESKNKLMAIISILAVIVTAFTFSRSAWMGLVAGVVVILVIRHSKLLLLSPLALVGLFSTQVRERVSVIFTQSYWFDSTLDGRLWSLNNGFHIWSKYPLFGSGPGTYGGQLALKYASPVYLQGIQNGYVALYFTDNQWLQLLVQTGIIGLIIFALFVVNVFVELLTRYNVNKNWVVLGTLGAFVSFLVTGFFGNVLEFGAIAVPMGIILGSALHESK